MIIIVIIIVIVIILPAIIAICNIHKNPYHTSLVAMISAETPSKNMRAPHPIDEWTGERYLLSNSAREGVQKVAVC